MKIVNAQPRILGTCTGHKLMPGKNDTDALGITPAQLQVILADDQFRSWLKLGWVKLIQTAALAPSAPAVEELDDGEKPTEDALLGANLEQAKAMIAACNDENLLEAWYAKDKRKGVKKAIEERMAAITGLEPPAEDLPEGVDEVFDGGGAASEH